MSESLELLSDAKVETLRPRLEALVGGLPDHLGYDSHRPAWVLLFQVLAAGHDPRLDVAARRRVRECIKRELPKCFQKTRAVPGRKGRLPEGAVDRRRLRQADEKIRALIKTKHGGMTSAKQIGILTKQIAAELATLPLPNRVTEVGEYLRNPQPPFDMTRDLLADALGVHRRTIDTWLSPRKWRPVSPGGFRRAYERQGLLLSE